MDSNTRPADRTQPEPISPGDRLSIQTADGLWIEATAITPVEGTHTTDPSTGRQRKAHDFPVVWINATGNDGRPFVAPWPAEHVRREIPDGAHTPSRGTPRSASQAHEAWEQACRQRWRALNLVIKAKLEAVESGISTFDSEFLAHLVLPDGRTVADHVMPSIDEAYETNTMPALLPQFDGPKAITA